jgi:hypothetical protein
MPARGLFVPAATKLIQAIANTLSWLAAGTDHFWSRFFQNHPSADAA